MHKRYGIGAWSCCAIDCLQNLNMSIKIIEQDVGSMHLHGLNKRHHTFADNIILPAVKVSHIFSGGVHISSYMRWGEAPLLTENVIVVPIKQR